MGRGVRVGGGVVVRGRARKGKPAGETFLLGSNDQKEKGSEQTH
jgi:hypothetical protein